MNKLAQLAIVGAVALTLGLSSGLFILPLPSITTTNTQINFQTRTIISYHTSVSILTTTTTETQNSIVLCTSILQHAASLQFVQNFTHVILDFGNVSVFNGSQLVESEFVTDPAGYAVFPGLDPGNYNYSIFTLGEAHNSALYHGSFTMGCADYSNSTKVSIGLSSGGY